MKNVTLGSIAEDHFRDVTEMVSIRSGADVVGAIDEVARANLEKVGPDSTTDSNGKIIKPEGWEPPNLEPFIYKMS